ncbi:GATA transcription factor 7-like [Bidens hawaiensis]|uniref:GATA transcription factor 7-like n=1 Tax=Bidens hawaiensis TaxID=980011 RepID=UPI0040493474
MECIEARALKSSFLPEIIGMKSSQQAYFDDFWQGINNVVNVSSDDFSVDDLLDLSDKEFSNPEEEFASVSSDSNSINSSMLSSAGDLVSLAGDQLPVPIDDMESLEWLSQIVDDSVSEIPILYPPVKLEQRVDQERVDRVFVSRFEPVVNVSGPSFTVLGLPYPVPRKCRSKGSRRPGRVWSSGSRWRTLTESSSSSSSSHDSSITSPMLFRNPVYFTELFERPPAAKKQRKSPAYQNGPSSSDSASQRRCTHCQVQKTPQWRTGPLGPKTLCNACGVRFKSGRLYPEYRPACSPTFSVDVHSNSHRKVLEMRKRKEVEVDMGLNLTVQTDSGSNQLIEPVLVA